MRYSLITQIILLTLSAVIFVTVVRPMFTTISDLQDQKLVYADAVDKAQQFNQKLQELISIRDSFRPEDVDHLNAFLPVQVDVPKVMNEIGTIFTNAQVQIISLASPESENGNAEVTLDENGNEVVNQNTLHSTDFIVTFAGTYDDLKNVLKLAEVNDTLLEVTNLSFGDVGTETTKTAAPAATAQATQSATGPKKFTFTVTFRVYGLKAPAIAPTPTTT